MTRPGRTSMTRSTTQYGPLWFCQPQPSRWSPQIADAAEARSAIDVEVLLEMLDDRSGNKTIVARAEITVCRDADTTRWRPCRTLTHWIRGDLLDFLRRNGSDDDPLRDVAHRRVVRALSGCEWPARPGGDLPAASSSCPILLDTAMGRIPEDALLGGDVVALRSDGARGTIARVGALDARGMSCFLIRDLGWRGAEEIDRVGRCPYRRYRAMADSESAVPGSRIPDAAWRRGSGRLLRTCRG